MPLIPDVYNCLFKNNLVNATNNLFLTFYKTFRPWTMADVDIGIVNMDIVEREFPWYSQNHIKVIMNKGNWTWNYPWSIGRGVGGMERSRVFNRSGLLNESGCKDSFTGWTNEVENGRKTYWNFEESWHSC